MAKEKKQKDYDKEVQVDLSSVGDGSFEDILRQLSKVDPEKVKDKERAEKDGSK